MGQYGAAAEAVKTGEQQRDVETLRAHRSDSSTAPGGRLAWVQINLHGPVVVEPVVARQARISLWIEALNDPRSEPARSDGLGWESGDLVVPGEPEEGSGLQRERVDSFVRLDGEIVEDSSVGCQAGPNLVAVEGEQAPGRVDRDRPCRVIAEPTGRRDLGGCLVQFQVRLVADERARFKSRDCARRRCEHETGNQEGTHTGLQEESPLWRQPLEPDELADRERGERREYDELEKDV